MILKNQMDSINHRSEEITEKLKIVVSEDKEALEHEFEYIDNIRDILNEKLNLMKEALFLKTAVSLLIFLFVTNYTYVIKVIYNLNIETSRNYLYLSFFTIVIIDSIRNFHQILFKYKNKDVISYIAIVIISIFMFYKILQ